MQGTTYLTEGRQEEPKVAAITFYRGVIGHVPASPPPLTGAWLPVGVAVFPRHPDRRPSKESIKPWRASHLTSPQAPSAAP